jgi:hypothetical protein
LFVTGTLGRSVASQVATHDIEQVTRGTIGAGTIVIRDKAHQTQDVAEINRDPSKAQVITKNERSGVSVYGSDRVPTNELPVSFGPAAKWLSISQNIHGAGDG